MPDPPAHGQPTPGPGLPTSSCPKARSSQLLGSPPGVPPTLGSQLDPAMPGAAGLPREGLLASSPDLPQPMSLRSLGQARGEGGSQASWAVGRGCGGGSCTPRRARALSLRRPLQARCLGPASARCRSAGGGAGAGGAPGRARLLLHSQVRPSRPGERRQLTAATARSPADHTSIPDSCRAPIYLPRRSEQMAWLTAAHPSPPTTGITSRGPPAWAQAAGPLPWRGRRGRGRTHPVCRVPAQD